MKCIKGRSENSPIVKMENDWAAAIVGAGLATYASKLDYKAQEAGRRPKRRWWLWTLVLGAPLVAAGTAAVALIK